MKLDMKNLEKALLALSNEQRIFFSCQYPVSSLYVCVVIINQSINLRGVSTKLYFEY